MVAGRLPRTLYGGSDAPPCACFSSRRRPAARSPSACSISPTSREREAAPKSFFFEPVKTRATGGLLRCCDMPCLLSDTPLKPRHAYALLLVGALTPLPHRHSPLMTITAQVRQLVT